MRKKKICLVAHYYENELESCGGKNLGIEFLKAAITHETILESWETENLYLYPNSIEHALSLLLEQEALIYGFSCYFWNVDIVHELASQLREQLQNQIYIILGGPGVNFNKSLFFDSSVKADALVIGEGERRIVAMLSALTSYNIEKSNEIRNSWSRIPGVITSLEPPLSSTSSPSIFEHRNYNCSMEISDLNELPSPYLSGQLQFINKNSAFFEFSRGCLMHCSFCDWSRGSQRVRRFNKERIKAEIGWAMDQGYSSINFFDSALNSTPGLLQDISNILVNYSQKQCYIMLHHQLVTQEDLESLIRIQHPTLFFGIETIHDPILNLLNKTFIKKKFEHAVEFIMKNAGTTIAAAILGLPGDTFLGFKETVDYFLNLPVSKVRVFHLAVIPGTKLWERRNEFKFDFEGDWVKYHIKSNTTFTLDDMMQAKQYIKELKDTYPDRIEFYDSV